MGNITKIRLLSLIFTTSMLIQCRAEDQKHKVTGDLEAVERDASDLAGESSFSFDERTPLTREELLKVLADKGDDIIDTESMGSEGGNKAELASHGDSEDPLKKARVEGNNEEAHLFFSMDENDLPQSQLGPMSALGIQLDVRADGKISMACQGANFSGIKGVGELVLRKALLIRDECLQRSKQYGLGERLVAKMNIKAPPAFGMNQSRLSRKYMGSPDGDLCRFKFAGEGKDRLASVEGSCLNFIEEVTQTSGGGRDAANMNLTGLSAANPSLALPSVHTALALGAANANAPKKNQSILIRVDSSNATREAPLLPDDSDNGVPGDITTGKMAVRINNWEGSVDFGQLNARRQPAYTFTRMDAPGETVSGFIGSASGPLPTPTPTPTPPPRPPVQDNCVSVEASTFPRGAGTIPAGKSAGYFNLSNSLSSRCTASGSSAATCRQFKTIDSAGLANSREAIKPEYGLPSKRTGAAYYEIYVLRSCPNQLASMGLSPQLDSGVAEFLSMSIESSGKIVGQGVSSPVMGTFVHGASPRLPWREIKAGDVIQVLADFDNKRLYLGRNNEWIQPPQIGTSFFGAAFNSGKATAGILLTKFDQTTIGYVPFVSLGAGVGSSCQYGPIKLQIYATHFARGCPVDKAASGTQGLVHAVTVSRILVLKFS